jgi:hypothetical protein
MDYSRYARQLALELSDTEIVEGLSEANRSRRKEATITTEWIGLPAPLRNKMIDRTAARLDAPARRNGPSAG